MESTRAVSEISYTLAETMSEDGRISLLHILSKLPPEKLALFKSRVKACPYEELEVFADRFAHTAAAASPECFQQHINFLTSTLHRPTESQVNCVVPPRTLSSAAHSHIQSTYHERALQLPYELRAMILHTYFEALPAQTEMELFPCETHRDGNCFVYSTSSMWCKHALRALDSELYDQHEHRYFSENTVIVKPGPTTPTLDVLKTLPSELMRCIPSVRLVLSTTDLEKNFTTEYDDRQDMLANYFAFYDHCSGHQLRLIWLWWDTAKEFFTLEPWHVVLDVRDAFTVDGSWLGTYWAKRLYLRRDGPRNYEVVGPSREREADVRRVIEDRRR